MGSRSREGAELTSVEAGPRGCTLCPQVCPAPAEFGSEDLGPVTWSLAGSRRHCVCERGHGRFPLSRAVSCAHPPEVLWKALSTGACVPRLVQSARGHGGRRSRQGLCGTLNGWPWVPCCSPLRWTGHPALLGVLGIEVRSWACRMGPTGPPGVCGPWKEFAPGPCLEDEEGGARQAASGPETGLQGAPRP